MIRCIAIDDEPLALKQIQAYISKTPYLELVNSFDSALPALDFLQSTEVDLMFVDINMPDLSGMDFVKALNTAPKVIFTTAYSEYAVEGFKVDAADYLLKPISYASFLKAADKVNKRYFSQVKATEPKVNSTDSFIYIKSEYKLVKINYHDIKYIEGMREYVRINIEAQDPIMSLMSMKKMEEHLPSSHFMRVHRSFIVNLSKVTIVERNRIVFDKKTYIPVSDQYKDAFQHYLDTNFLK